MKQIAAFFSLVRWPNLVFIAITQILFEFCIYQKVYPSAISNTPLGTQFVLLMVASVFIAAAGYIINDYFDQNIDQVNKPTKMIVGVSISRRWVIFWHMLLSLLGLFFTVYALPQKGYWYLVSINLSSILLLWFYSTNFKKQLLIGNIIISLLTAWVILVIYFSKYPIEMETILVADHAKIQFFKLAILYAGFAFIISLIREVIKDMEDIEGDRKYGCKTMPIVWGLNASKVFVSVWMIVLIAALLIIQFYVLPFGWWMSVVYCLLAIIAPLIWMLKKLYTAKQAKDFHQLSIAIKIIMLTGILSMLFFSYYL